ncbi:Oidioi.mRNA.OKI2018_I69.chr2.g4736.t1.cds [Oikopleura dioica]|uniref:Oidioi.mRNA.OKI2018_I69.chr2.g4736.t1.cds n=1 Tax=Oikopleura dioica TaxID=34765 RepID=A0ABN7T2J2_OIKDI|nr:Oidioi.mRNA.OKI2018_I69.chr2.g4736.t1.cds [Oikopleura dioica]
MTFSHSDTRKLLYQELEELRKRRLDAKLKRKDFGFLPDLHKKVEKQKSLFRQRTKEKIFDDFSTSVQLLEKSPKSSFPVESIRKQLVYLAWSFGSICSGVEQEEPIFLQQRFEKHFPHSSEASWRWLSFLNRDQGFSRNITEKDHQLLLERFTKKQIKGLQMDSRDQGLILRQMKQSRAERMRALEKMTHQLHRKFHKDRQFQMMRMTARRVTKTKGQEINPLETWFSKFLKRFSNEEKEEIFKQELKVLKAIKPPYLDEKLTDSFMRFCHRVDRYLLQDPDMIGALYYLSSILKVKGDFIKFVQITNQ